jgi:hypothetical protein
MALVNTYVELSNFDGKRGHIFLSVAAEGVTTRNLIAVEGTAFWPAGLTILKHCFGLSEQDVRKMLGADAEHREALTYAWYLKNWGPVWTRGARAMFRQVEQAAET